MNQALYNLVQQSLNHYQAALNHPSLSTFVPDCAMPVAWFGDSDAYFKSPKRIVTVGLNPKSGINPKWHINLAGAGAGVAVGHLYDVYDDYFIGNTLATSVDKKQWGKDYLVWFKSLDTRIRSISTCMAGQGGALACLDASYNGKISLAMGKSATTNTMLHLDLYSTAPTNHAWSSLPGKEKDNLIRNVTPSGRQLFNDALAALNPDVVIFGVGMSGNQPRNYFNTVPSWNTVVRDSKGKIVAAGMNQDLNVYTGQTCLNKQTRFVWLKSSNKPFLGCPVTDAVKVF